MMMRTWLGGVSLLVASVMMVGLATAADPYGDQQGKSNAATADTSGGQKDIADKSSTDKNLSTFFDLAEKAGLIETLKSKGPFTVFVPSNDAFAKLSPGTLDALKSDKAKLREVLLYHVVPGKVMAADIAQLKTAKTASGDEVSIDASGEEVMIGDAKVIKADVQCGNGVIHVIDTVLMP